MTTTHLPEMACPRCATKLDACTDPRGTRVPRPGDITVCLYCHAALVFGPQMQLSIAPEHLLPPRTKAMVRHVRSLLRRAEGKS